jgi:hypothetical protein
MENLKIAAIAMMITIAVISGCKKEDRCSVHPEPFRFSIIDSHTSADLIETGVFTYEAIGIYYIYKGKREDLIVNRETNPLGPYTELKVIQLPMISLTGRSNIFYLELTPEMTDTLEINVEREAVDDCDYHPYTLAKHNGVEMPTELGGVFIIEK